MNDTNPAGTPAKSWWKQHPKWTIFLVLMGVGLVGTIVDGGPTPQNNPPVESQPVVAEEKQEDNRKVSIGEKGILNIHKDASDCSGIVVVAKTEETHEDIVKAGVANDTYALAEFISNGKALAVPACSEVLVIDQGFGRREVRLTNTGESGWVSMEFVRAI